MLLREMLSCFWEIWFYASDREMIISLNVFFMLLKKKLPKFREKSFQNFCRKVPELLREKLPKFWKRIFQSPERSFHATETNDSNLLRDNPSLGAQAYVAKHQSFCRKASMLSSVEKFLSLEIFLCIWNKAIMLLIETLSSFWREFFERLEEKLKTFCKRLPWHFLLEMWHLPTVDCHFPLHLSFYGPTSVDPDYNWREAKHNQMEAIRNYAYSV